VQRLENSGPERLLAIAGAAIFFCLIIKKSLQWVERAAGVETFAVAWFVVSGVVARTSCASDHPVGGSEASRL